MKRRALRPLVMLTALFLLGGATGVFGTLAFVHRREARMVRNGQGFEDRRMHGLARRLDLDDEQRAALRALMRDNREQSRALGKEMMDRCGEPLRAHHAAFDTKLRALLRPEQIQRYEELQRERPFTMGPPGEFGHVPPPPFP